MVRGTASVLIISSLIATRVIAAVDHSDVDRVASLPQSTMDAIGLQKWFFIHASLGGNMIQGMTDLAVANPTRYRLVTSSVGYSSTLRRANDPPSPTLAGTIYECNWSNAVWQDKITAFANSVNTAGWHDPAVNVAMGKFSYVDQVANPTTYINAMVALEVTYPNTIFVYMTMPLMASGDDNNILRNQFSEAVRTFCANNHKLLFDIADMEAHDPDGNESTFTSGGKTYQKLYSGYTDDGGHLNTVGRQRIATGWYAVAAVIATASVAGDLNYDGHVDQADLDLFEACVSGPGIPRNNLPVCQIADFDHDGDVDHADFGLLQQYLGR